MKKQLIYQNGMLGVCILAFFTSCMNTNAYDENSETKAFMSQYAQNFSNALLNGGTADDSQTWNTATKLSVSATAPVTGTLKIYQEDPVGNLPAALYTAAISAGESTTFDVARPQGATTLHAAIVAANNDILANMPFDASGTKVSVGFDSSTTTSSSAVLRMKRAIRKAASTHVFASAPAASDYVSTSPKPESSNISDNNGEFCAGSSTTNVNLWGSGSKLYITGNCKPSYFYIGGSSTIYITKGATFTLPGGDFTYGQCTNKIYVDDGATLICNGHLQMSNTSLYNKGTVKTTGDLEAAGSGLIYNQGTITTNKIYVSNSTAEIVNDGTLTATSLVVAGSGHVENNGTATITGTTDITSNSCTWINNGTYTSSTYNYIAGSAQVINNCRLTVTGQTYMNLGDTSSNGFTNDSGASVTTNTLLLLGPNYIYMGSGSLFKVTDTAYMGITKSSYGIYGPTSGSYAVFQADKIVRASDIGDNQGFVVSYFNNLYVATNSHFANGYSDVSAADQAAGKTGSQPYYVLSNGAAMAKSSTTAPVTIAASTCNPGYTPDGAVTEPTMYYYYAFEDLGTSDDFDFNDVVLRVSAPNESKVSTVELCALGGILPVKAIVNGTQMGSELHTEFGLTANSSMSTAGNTYGSVVTAFKQIGTISNVTDASNADVCLQVTDKNGTARTIVAPSAGNIPFMIRVAGNASGKWYWTSERVNISDAYPQFGAWGCNYSTSTTWYNTYVEGKVTKW